MTVYLVPEILKVLPTAYLFSLAYDLLTTATFASVCVAVKVLPEVIFEVASGPRPWSVTSTPATESVHVEGGAAALHLGRSRAAAAGAALREEPPDVEDFAVPWVKEPSRTW